MNFKVMNRREAIKYTYEPHEDRSVIISISCYLDSTPKFNFGAVKDGVKAILYARFDDIDIQGDKIYVDGGHMISPEKAKEYTCISDQEAENIVDFVTRWEDKIDTIIVHCDAGISRSSGCCAAIMKALTGDDSQIFSNPKYRPNMTVYNKCLRYFANAGYTGVYGKHYNEF